MRKSKNPDIIAVCLEVTYNDKDIYDDKGNLKKDYIKQITSEHWRIDFEKSKDIQYVMGIKRGSIKSVYGINDVHYITPEENEKEAGKARLELYDIDEKMKQRIIKTFDNKIFFSKNPVKYFYSEDLKD